jgi:hypothetical protein
MFAPNLPALFKERKGIAVGFQGRGRSADIVRPELRCFGRKEPFMLSVAPIRADIAASDI